VDIGEPAAALIKRERAARKATQVLHDPCGAC
jgi:hypothetical protein